MNYQDELLNYAPKIQKFTSRFIKEDEWFLQSEDVALYKQTIHEVKDLFDAIWGNGNYYSQCLLSTVNADLSYLGDPSYVSVEQISGLIMAAHKKYSRELKYPNFLDNRSNLRVFIDPNRISQLTNLQKGNYDLTRLIELCLEINIAVVNNSFLSVAMIAKTIINHIPPIFDCKKFSQVANNYDGGRTFKELMQRLDNSLKKIADIHLHKQISRNEVLPTYT